MEWFSWVKQIYCQTRSEVLYSFIYELLCSYVTNASSIRDRQSSGLAVLEFLHELSWTCNSNSFSELLGKKKLKFGYEQLAYFSIFFHSWSIIWPKLTSPVLTAFISLFLDDCLELKRSFGALRGLLEPIPKIYRVNAISVSTLGLNWSP